MVAFKTEKNFPSLVHVYLEGFLWYHNILSLESIQLRVFALQNYGQCMGSAAAESEYTRYGYATCACSQKGCNNGNYVMRISCATESGKH